MKVCIIGGTGNISTSIVELLLEQGHRVTCFNRGLRGRPPEGAEVIVGDRDDAAAFEAVMRAHRFDAAIDMVCYTPEHARSDVRAFAGVSHFVQCSTVVTYGVQLERLPADEDHPLNAADPYGLGKIAADAVFMDAHEHGGFPVTIVKPGTTIGPLNGPLRQLGLDFGWVDRIRKGLPILVIGNGEQSHQFLDVEDAAGCFAHLLGKRHCLGQVYNMVQPVPVTWRQYHQTAMGALGRQVEMVGIGLDRVKSLGSAIPGYDAWVDNFAYDALFGCDKLAGDVPEFRPVVPLGESLEKIIAFADRKGLIPRARPDSWEDRIIAAVR